MSKREEKEDLWYSATFRINARSATALMLPVSEKDFRNVNFI